MYPFANYKVIEIRPSTVLTTSYVAGDLIDSTSVPYSYANNQLLFYVDVALGSLDSVEFIVEFSADETTWFQESIEGAPAGGTSIVTPYVRQFTADGRYRVGVPM